MELGKAKCLDCNNTAKLNKPRCSRCENLHQHYLNQVNADTQFLNNIHEVQDPAVAACLQALYDLINKD